MSDDLYRYSVCESVLSLEWPHDDWPPGGLMDFAEWLREIIEEIPEQFRGNAKIRIGSTMHYDSDYPTIEIDYWRPPTEEEVAERKATAARKAEQRTAEELGQLRKLQEKYGTNP